MTVSTSSSTSSIVLTATAAAAATLALLVFGPLGARQTFPGPKTKIKPPALPLIEPVQPLSASWSFVDQSTTKILEAANKYRARDHAEKIFAELVNPETYYDATRQAEFGVEVMERGSGITRYIRKRKAREARGVRVLVERRYGEEEQPGRGKCYLITDTLNLFNCNIQIKHLLYVEGEHDESDPIVVLELEVIAIGPVLTAWVIGRQYAERLKGLCNAIENRWNGKDGLGR